MRSQVRFNTVPEKVKVWEALVQSQVKFKQEIFGRRFQRTSGRLWCRARSGSTGLRLRGRSGRLWCREGSAKVPGNFGSKPSKVQLGSGEGSGESS